MVDFTDVKFPGRNLKCRQKKKEKSITQSGEQEIVNVGISTLKIGTQRIQGNALCLAMLGRNRMLNLEKRTCRSGEMKIKNVMQKLKGFAYSNTKLSSSKLTVDAVHVAEKNILSFLQSSILIEMGKITEKLLGIFTNGLFPIIFQKIKDCQSYA